MDQGSPHRNAAFPFAIAAIFTVVVFGLFWFFFLGPETPVGLGWYLFSFAAGLTMIVLPCTLPLAFVIVPLSMGKSAAKGIGMAVSFGIGVAIMLSLYGVAAAIVGEVAIGTLGAPLEVVKNWLYFLAGIFAYLFALSEIGLINFRMPTYSGAAPAFIQKRSDYLKALLLGLFLGNVGVGCPHPATPVILTRIAVSGDVFYGWLLFFVHAVGRVLPLLLLAFLAVLGVNALSWLVARKDKVERATGWGMIFVAAFILVLGLFTHDWWVASGQHTLLEEITQEERFLGIIIDRFNLGGLPHSHDLPTGEGLFGLPVEWGSWVLVLLWILPLWWYFFKKKKFAAVAPDEEKKIETRVLPWRLWLNVVLSAFLIITFVYYLPLRFLHQTETHMMEEMMSEKGMMREDMHTDAGHDASAETQYHEEGAVREGLAVNLNITPVPVAAGTSTRLDFFVNEKPGNIPVTDLEIEHEKLMHVIGVRSDLNEFFHIHPVVTDTPGLLSVNHVFSQPGFYKIWSEVKKDGENHAFGHPETSVTGEGAREEKKVSFGRNVIIGQYQVSLKLDEPVVKGHEHELSFDIHTFTGDEVEVEEYLAAKMHLSVIKDDWNQFMHIHPVRDAEHAALGENGAIAESNGQELFQRNKISNGAHPEEEGDHHGIRLVPEAFANGDGDAHGAIQEKGKDEVINFNATFPEAGLYKAFAQFRPKGIDLPQDEALTAEFWIKVEEKAPSTISPWWINFVWAIAAIVVLSILVKRYLQVR